MGFGAAVALVSAPILAGVLFAPISMEIDRTVAVVVTLVVLGAAWSGIKLVGGEALQRLIIPFRVKLLSAGLVVAERDPEAAANLLIAGLSQPYLPNPSLLHEQAADFLESHGAGIGEEQSSALRDLLFVNIWRECVGVHAGEFGHDLPGEAAQRLQDLLHELASSSSGLLGFARSLRLSESGRALAASLASEIESCRDASLLRDVLQGQESGQVLEESSGTAAKMAPQLAFKLEAQLRQTLLSLPRTELLTVAEGEDPEWSAQAVEIARDLLASRETLRD